MKKYLLFGLFLFSGILFGYSLSYLNAFTGAVDYPPSSRQSNFVKACSQLNGEELNIDNLQKLEGWCWPFTECSEIHLERLKNGTDPFFNIYQRKDKDNTWICGVTTSEDNTIKAWAYYQFE